MLTEYITSSHDHAEHYAKHAADNWLGNGDEKCSEFGKNSKTYHHKACRLDHSSATDLRKEYKTGHHNLDLFIGSSMYS